MHKYHALTRFATAVVTLLVYSQQAHAGWQICNKTQQRLSIAIAYIEPPTPGIADYLSQGWWTVNACSCVTVLQRRETSVSNEGYLYAEDASKFAIVSGPYKYCVDAAHQPFRYKNTNVQCTRRNFQKVQVDLNKSTWTTSIDGQPACQTY